jgi:hypothetical protein
MGKQTTPAGDVELASHQFSEDIEVTGIALKNENHLLSSETNQYLGLRITGKIG